MSENFDNLKKILIKENILATESNNLDDKKIMEFLKKEVASKNSDFNILLNEILVNEDFEKFNLIGTSLNNNNIKLNFKALKIKELSIASLKEVIKYADDATCSNKGAVVKTIIKADDLEGIDILLENNFIIDRNVDRYLNFALNSRKYTVVPKLIEKKNS